MLAATSLSALALASCNKIETSSTADSLVAAKINAGIQTKVQGATWDPNDAIGITTSGNAKKDGSEYLNIKYTIDGTGTFRGSDIFYQNPGDVTFTAYYPYLGQENSKPGTDGVISSKTSAANQSGNAQKLIDYMWAQTTAKVSSPDVNFTGGNAFTHKMSMLTLTFKKGDDVLLADLSKYTLGGLTLDGQFNTINGTANANGTAEPLSITLSDVAEGTSYTAGSLILFPQSIGTGKIQLTVTLNAQEYKTELTLASLETGKNHTFNITVKKTGISSAAAEITDWVAEPGADAEATM